MNFVDELPPVFAGRRAGWENLLAELRAHPGQWGEVARYEKDRKASAYARGGSAVRRNPGLGLEYAVRQIDGEYALFMRINEIEKA